MEPPGLWVFSAQRFSKIAEWDSVTYIFHEWHISCVRLLLDKAFKRIKIVGSLQELQPNNLYFQKETGWCARQIKRALEWIMTSVQCLSMHRPVSSSIDGCGMYLSVWFPNLSCWWTLAGPISLHILCRTRGRTFKWLSMFMIFSRSKILS